MTTHQAQPVVVRAGEVEAQGEIGVAMKMLTVGAQSDGQWLVLEYQAPPNFSGPPLHVHRVTTEIFYVLDGTLTVHVDGQAVQLTPGGCAYVPPGVVHGFANETDAPARYLLVASPAGLERYFAELAELIKDEPSWPPADMSKVVTLMTKYDTFSPSVG